MKGSVATSGALPSSGNTQGDAYIVQSDDSLWIWDGTTWVSGGSIQGPPGSTGAQGIQGVQGPTGATGSQGPKGDPGVQGPIGNTGPTGPTGDTGPQGIQGVQGPQGVKGDTGLTGSTGSQGPAGQGVPTGGTTGQVLTKTSATDYATVWQAVAGGPPTGPAGGDLGGTYPNPTAVKASGDFAISVIGNALTLQGIGATKGRLWMNKTAGSDHFEFTCNARQQRYCMGH